jgi:predicted ABC-type ATPase
LSIVAGANGSGKTTFALSYATFRSIVFVNADEIAKSLNPGNMEQEKFRAGKIFLE